MIKLVGLESQLYSFTISEDMRGVNKVCKLLQIFYFSFFFAQGIWDFFLNIVNNE